MSPAVRSTALATLALAAIIGVAAGTGCVIQMGATVKLVNGWSITESGKTVTVGDLPVGTALRPDGKVLAVVSAGSGNHEVNFFDVASGDHLSTQVLTKAWNGVAWSPDGKTLYVSGGVDGVIHQVSVSADAKTVSDTKISIPSGTADGADEFKQGWLSGLVMTGPDTILFAGSKSDKLYKFDLKSKAITQEYEFAKTATPYALVLSPDKSKVAVALQGSGQVELLDAKSLKSLWIAQVGRHPNALAFVGNRLFVTCGNDDTVVSMDTKAGVVHEKIVTRPYPNGVAGSTPSSISARPDGSTLYITNSDNNNVAVVDIKDPDQSRVTGFIPTDWYPVSTFVTPNGKDLFIACGKGRGNLGPNGATQGNFDHEAPKSYPYIVTLLKGSVSFMPVPTSSDLVRLTSQAFKNIPYSLGAESRPVSAPPRGSNPVPSVLGDESPIKHVLYIIKENRTYDQVFGDMTDSNGKPIGNGDKDLCLFTEDVSPNHHELAREFGLMDNLYCLGEVSVDGHHWTNGAYVPDYMQRTWPQQYSGKGAPRLTKDLAETPNGRIWVAAERAGLNFRTYYYHTTANRSDAWAQARAAGRRDYDYVQVFIDEFKQFEKDKKVPQLMVMALSEDHTRGTAPGAFTPKACVGSNDLGIGKIVDAISHSSVWKNFAIFIIEDDAQNGADHVDAHRTVGLVVSPYCKQNQVVSTHYTSASMLRTMGLILGFQPMSQYDAAATPLYDLFTNTPDLTPYTARQPKIDLEAKNPNTAYGAAFSKTIDFSEPDQMTLAQENQLNRVLWHSIKGADVPYPGTVRRFGYHTTPEKEEDHD